MLTLGAEFIDNVHQNQQPRYGDPALHGFEIDHSLVQQRDLSSRTRSSLGAG